MHGFCLLGTLTVKRKDSHKKIKKYFSLKGKKYSQGILNVLVIAVTAGKVFYPF